MLPWNCGTTFSLIWANWWKTWINSTEKVFLCCIHFSCRIPEQSLLASLGERFKTITAVALLRCNIPPAIGALLADCPTLRAPLLNLHVCFLVVVCLFVLTLFLSLDRQFCADSTSRYTLHCQHFVCGAIIWCA